MTGLRLALSVGKLVLERIYGGDIALWHYRGHKDQSFRKLAKHPALPFAPSTLSRAVGMYEMSLRRPDLLELPNLTSSHLEQLLKLPNEQQDTLIDRTSERQWSVLQLRSEIERLEIATPRAPRRRQAPIFARLLRTLGLRIEQAVLLQDIEQVQRLARAETQQLLQTVRTLHDQSATLVEYLARHLAALRDAPERGPATQPEDPVRSEGTPRKWLPHKNTGRRRRGNARGHCSDAGERANPAGGGPEQ